MTFIRSARLPWVLLVACALVFGGWQLRQQVDANRIVLTPELLTSLAASQTAQSGRPASADELAAASENYVADEVLYREALRRGLDKGDPVIRRRLLQSMRFALEAELQVPEPSEAELAAFAQKQPLPGHGASYSFRHIFFSRERRGPAAQSDAAALAATMVAGDPFLHGSEVSGKRRQQIAANFGEAFAASVTGLTPGQWSQPLASAYGWHRVILQSREPSDWQERRQDYYVAWQQQWLDLAIADRAWQLRKKYHIVRP